MTTLTLAPPATAVPASDLGRPSAPHEMRPWDRIAFSAPQTSPPADDAPPLVWPGPPPADLPDPVAWSGTLVRACVEVLIGSRPAAQLARWMTPELHSWLTRRTVETGPPPAAPRRVQVLRVHVHEVDQTRMEAAVILGTGQRVRAAALRIEVHRGRWQATALEIG